MTDFNLSKYILNIWHSNNNLEVVGDTNTVHSVKRGANSVVLHDQQIQFMLSYDTTGLKTLCILVALSHILHKAGQLTIIIAM